MLDALINALNATGYSFAHWAWGHAPRGDYGVYAEDGAGGSVWADGKMQGQSVQVSIDYFTRNATDLPRTTIQNALTDANVAWYLNSVQYENDTRYIHYEWIAEVVG